MKCMNCGAQIEESASFCDQCGQPLKETPATRQPATSTKKASLHQTSRASPLGLAVEPEVVPAPAPLRAPPAPLPTRLGRKGAPVKIFSHWYTPIEGLQLPPSNFYIRLREAIEKREIPGVAISQVEWPEGGPMSPKRTYLRVTRKEHVLDICAAPFGKSFFVSWWLGRIGERGLLYLLAFVGLVLVIPFGFMFVFALLAQIFGLQLGSFLALIGVPLMAVLILYKKAEAVDHFLIQVPFIGPLYEKYIRPLTYYEVDTALMFQQAVHNAVQEVIDEQTKAKGLRTLSELERKPIMRDFLMR